MPAITPAEEPSAKPEQSSGEATVPEAEIPKRELLQAGLEKVADIIFDRGAVIPPDIDLSSLEKTEQTLRAFASTVDKLPAEVTQKYALWLSLDRLMRDFYEPEAVDKFKAAIDAIAEGRPIKAPPEKSKVPPSHEVPPEFRHLPHFVYLDRKETVLPAIKESLRPYDALLKSHGVPSPENRLGTLQDVMWTLTEYSNAIWRVDPYHAAVDSLRYDSDRLAKATEETLKSYEKKFAGTKLGNETYQKARPELEPLLNKMLDRLDGGLRSKQERAPSRDLSSLASATETLVEYQNAIGRATRGSPDIDVLNEVIYGLKNDPRSQVKGVMAYLGIAAPATPPRPSTPATQERRLNREATDESFNSLFMPRAPAQPEPPPAPKAAPTPGAAYELIKKDAIPLIKKDLARLDNLLKANGITPPEQQLETLKLLQGTFSDYRAAVSRLNPGSKEVDTLTQKLRDWKADPAGTLEVYKIITSPTP